ncbi:MAG: hypothetical protein JNK82_39015 [Myxococcaceae bacterium]|nr:hypothetical protein [Myxococcaceae bacterium]
MSRRWATLLAVAAASAGVWAYTVGTATLALPLGPLETPGGAQTSPLILSTPGRPIAVWGDERDRAFQIYASRLDPASFTALDGPGGVVLGRTFVGGYGFTAAWGGATAAPGGHVLALWGAGTGFEAFRLDLDGGNSGALSISAPGIIDAPALASNGDSFLVVWVDESVNPPRVLAMPLTPGGAAAGAPFATLSLAGVRGWHPRATWAGDRWVATWMEGASGDTDVMTRSIDPAGALGVTQTLSSARPGLYPEVAALPDGGAFVAFFQGPTHVLKGALVHTSLSPFTLDGDAGEPVLFGFVEQRPAMTAFGDDLYLAWAGWDGVSERDRVHFARLAPPHTAITSAVTRTSGPENGGEPALVVHEGRLLASYTNRDHEYDLGERSSADAVVEELGVNLGTVVGPVRFPAAYAEQVDPALASGAGAMFAAWSEYRGDAGYDVFAARVGDAGLETPRLVATGRLGQVDPALAVLEPGTLMLAWSDLAQTAVVARLYDLALQPLGPEQVVATAPGVPDYACVAAGAGTFLVAYSDGNDVRSRRYSATGVPLEAPQVQCAGCVSEGRPYFERTACAFGGGEFLVGWVDDRVVERAMVVGRVQLDGGRPDPTGIVVAIAPVHPAEPSVAWDGAQFQVIWHDHRNSLANGEVFGARVRNGVVLDDQGVQLVPASGAEQEFPQATAVPGGLLLTWFDEGVPQARGVHIVDGGRSGSIFPLHTGDGVTGLAVASLPDRTVFLSSRGQQGQTPLGSVRLYLNTVSRAATGGTCAVAYDCASGSCDAGVCDVPGGATAGGGGAGGGTAGGSTAGGAGAGGAAAGGGEAPVEPERKLNVGCACGAGARPELVLLALLSLRRRRCR